ncbi:hypothetical protein COLO4_12091 [Corchorus olitorius]|uniref:Uncharacterized protein n=1 Tax=Corchorus olitorius TaxID=93759 RepID=A0A1R3K293_9ROSI|nr:hypothetical protein COLO4_12091 [Corchorus olitorius]
MARSNQVGAKAKELERLALHHAKLDGRTFEEVVVKNGQTALNQGNNVGRKDVTTVSNETEPVHGIQKNKEVVVDSEKLAEDVALVNEDVINDESEDIVLETMYMERNVETSKIDDGAEHETQRSGEYQTRGESSQKIGDVNGAKFDQNKEQFVEDVGTVTLYSL